LIEAETYEKSGSAKGLVRFKLSNGCNIRA
jgi:hypothetical protein